MLFEDIEEYHLRLNPIWIEYYQPSELEEIVGVPKEWLKENLIEPSIDSECPPLYSALPSMKLENKEFLVAAVHVKVSEYVYFGYAFAAAQEITSLTLFFRDEEIKLYSSELLENDNIESLNRLDLRVDSDELRSYFFEYEFVSDEIHFLPKKASFECPLRL